MILPRLQQQTRASCRGRACPARRFHTCLGALIALCILLAGCGTAPQDPGEPQDTLIVWHSYATNGREESVFLRAMEGFRDAHPDIPVEVSYVRYLELVTQFITAAQGGEAPDLIRLSHEHLGEIGHVRVGGLPLLEDLRPHLTPQERLLFDPRAMQAMRYQSSLLALPAIQSCLSLIYNRDMFDQQGIAYPDANWTTEDMLRAAQLLSGDNNYALAVPVKWSYWWTPFQTGFGGRLFDANDLPSLNSQGSARALEFFLSLEQQHRVVQPGMHPESMKTAFTQGKAAMVVDGPWNWGTYLDAGLNIGQALLPIVRETGLRMVPMLSFHGWSVSTDSLHKPQAVRLAQWLTSEPVQLEFARATFSLPTLMSLLEGPELQENEALAGFMRQTQVCEPAPTLRATSLVYEPLDTALALVHQGDMSAEQALEAANLQMLKDIGR